MQHELSAFFGALASFLGSSGSVSVKRTIPDHLDRAVRVLILRSGDTQVLLKFADVAALFEREIHDEAALRGALWRAVFTPDQPIPPISSVLHAAAAGEAAALLTPPDLVGFSCSARAAEDLRALYGDRVALIAFTRAPLVMARQIAGLVREHPALQAIMISGYGLLVWGDGEAACERRARDLYTTAAAFIEARAGRRMATPDLAPEKKAILTTYLPVLRGVWSRQHRVIVRTRGLASLPNALPAHLPFWERPPRPLDWQPDQGVDVLKAQAVQRETGDRLPPPVILPGIGMITAGYTSGQADARAEQAQDALRMIEVAEACGGWAAHAGDSLPFGDNDPPPQGEFAGRIALVTGAASGIGRATAHRLAAAGAQVVIADIHQAAGAETARQIQASGGTAIAIPTDVTDEQSVIDCVRQTILAFGGLDILINNAGIANSAPFDETPLAMWQRCQAVLATGYFLMAREAFKVMKAQGIGGVMVFVGSKNSLAPSKGAAAYAAAKASEIHLARVLAEEGGAYGIRVNSVLPDAVIQGSAIWSEYAEGRAKEYGISPDQLGAYYQQRNTLKVEILPEDVAEAIAFLASDRAAKTTGALLTVDGGVATAYVR